MASFQTKLSSQREVSCLSPQFLRLDNTFRCHRVLVEILRSNVNIAITPNGYTIVNVDTGKCVFICQRCKSRFF